MPPIQGYINATLLDMTEVFGEPEKLKGGGVQWKLDGGTVLAGEDVPHGWDIAGWSKAAVDQVIGRAARAGRFLRVAKAKGRETVHVAQAPVAQLAEGTWTVLGLIAPGSDELLVAGVVQGEHQCADSHPQTGGYGRYATSVTAGDPDEAERLAAAEVGYGYYEDRDSEGRDERAEEEAV
jgi:hypothetical protein